MEISSSVLIADEDDTSRREFARVLTDAGYNVVQAATGDGALEFARTMSPCLVILEIPLPGLSGYEVCRAVKAELGNELPVMFASGSRTESYDRVAGLLVGADDYVVKPVAPDELLARVRNLLRRAERVTPSIAATLTRREHEVLELLGEGISQSEIARLLVISPKTVATHIENLMRKLGVRSRAQAVAVAYREDILHPRLPTALGPRG